MRPVFTSSIRAARTTVTCCAAAVPTLSQSNANAQMEQVSFREILILPSSNRSIRDDG